MSTDTIKCPNCGVEIRLSEAISHDMEVTLRTKYEKEYSDKLLSEKKMLWDKAKRAAEDKITVELTDLKQQITEKDKQVEKMRAQELEMRKRERMLLDKEEEFRKEKEEQAVMVKEQIQRERKDIEAKIKTELEKTQSVVIHELNDQLKEKEKSLVETQQKEIELRKQQRALDEKVKNAELEMSRKIDEERKMLIDKLGMEYAEKHRLRDAEKDKQLGDMRKQIEDLQRKAEQGSQQAQGEVLELEIESILKENFPFDEVIPVSKGIKGGDVIHTVKTQSGRICGKILWETKRTKVWSDGWIQKLKDDQREAKAEISVIVSEVLPKGFHHFRQIDEVWVSDIPSALSLALALRVILTQVAKEQEIQTGKEEKKEIVYNYITGTEFRNRVQAIMESFIAMKTDLDSEKRAMSKIWAQREKQIEKITLNIAGMRGDIEGIVGSALPAIKILELESVAESKD